jgi:hypothetical protein
MVLCRVCDFIPSPVITVDDNGIGRGVARIARAGIYLYLMEELKSLSVEIPSGYDKKLVPVLKSPESVKRTAHLFDSIPLTIEHNWINPNNHHMIKGWGAGVNYVNGWLETATALEAEAMDAYRRGYDSFSTGQKADLIYSPGSWIDTDGIMGEVGKSYEYDFTLTPIASNHLALVKKSVARAGINSIDKPGFIGDSIVYDGIILGEDFMDIPDGMIPIKMGDMTGYMTKDMSSYFDGLFGVLGELLESLGGEEETTSLSMGDASYSMPKNVKDMMGRCKDMFAKKGKDSLADSGEYILAETYKMVEQELRKTKTSLGKIQLQNIELTTKLNDATDPTKLTAIITERTESFKQAQPYLQGVEFDPQKESIYWKKQVLEKAGTTAAVLDSYNPGQIDAAFTAIAALRPQQKQSSNLSDQIAKYRQSSTQGEIISFADDLPQNRRVPSILK